MANIVMLLGKSGTGKSTSIKTLNPKETVIVNLLKKRLPFKGSSQLYNEEQKNLFNIDSYDKIVSLLSAINGQSSIKNIILEDFTYLMRKEYFATAKITGFNKFVDMASHFQQIISTAESLRDDLNVFIIMHSEDVVSDNSVIGYKASTVGKLVDSSYNPIEVVPMLLYSTIKFDDKGTPTYGFYTHAVMEGTTLIPAKTPADMFEEDFIPNDLGLVVKTMNEYYG